MFEEKVAYELAMKMYDGFFNALMTAVENSIRNFERAADVVKMDINMDPVEKAYASGYYNGKMDAFRELANRLQKEHDLACQDLKNWFDVENKYDIDEVFATAIKDTWINFVYQTIKRQKNEEVDRIFPDGDFRMRRVYDKVMRMKGQLASLLEYYGWEGFQLGRKFENDTIRIGDAENFDPEKFAGVCIEKFVPEDYRDF